MLRSEMYVPAYQERLGLLLNLYLIRCGGYRDALYRQLVVNESIRQIAEDLKLQPSKSRENYAKQHLETLNASLPETYSLCLNPRIELKCIKAAKCKVMTSKKLPLWLVFQNADENGDDYYSIYKAGDDLRQDQLILQTLGVMEALWKAEGLDLRMTPYRTVSTGECAAACACARVRVSCVLPPVACDDSNLRRSGPH
jgi:phosphatidylinositol-4,5-bisphosphate 3-kinase